MNIHRLTPHGVMYSIIHTLLSECNAPNGNAPTAATVEALNNKGISARNDMNSNNTKKVSCTVLRRYIPEHKTALTFFCRVGNLKLSPQTKEAGFGSPRAKADDRHPERFFYVRSMAPFYGGAVWEGATPAGSFARSSNLHGSATPFGSGKAEIKNRIAKDCCHV